MNLQKVTKLFKKYKKAKDGGDFYNWLNNNHEDCLENYDSLKNIYNMFVLTENHENLKIYENIRIINTTINKEQMRSILEEDGFVFNCN